MIHSKQTYVKNNKKLLRKVHSKWTIVSVALLSMIGLGGLSIHQANADSIQNNKNPNIVTNWYPHAANIQSNSQVNNQENSHINSQQPKNSLTQTNYQSTVHTNNIKHTRVNTTLQSARIYPFNYQINLIDKKSGALIQSRTGQVDRPNGYINNFKNYINSLASEYKVKLLPSDKTSIRFKLGQGQNINDPNTGFTKQPAGTVDDATPNIGWHVYVSPTLRVIPSKNGRKPIVIGAPALITGDFSNYHPLYSIGKIKSTLESMGVNTNNIFPNSQDSSITGLFGNKLPAAIKQSVDQQASNDIKSVVNEFNNESASQRQFEDNELLDPDKYVPYNPEHTDQAARENMRRQHNVVGFMQRSANLKYLTSVFPELADVVNQYSDIALKSQVCNAYTKYYVPAFVNYINRMDETISQIYLGNATNLKSTQSMFSNLPNLLDVKRVGNFDTSNVTNMSDMFQNCPHLSNIEGLSDLNTHNVYEMQDMFQNDIALQDITPLKFWDTHNVINTSKMFAGYDNVPGSLSNLSPLTNWDTSNLMSMGGMFMDQANITDITPLKDWKLSPYIYGLGNTFKGDINIKTHPNWQPTNGPLVINQWFYTQAKNPLYGSVPHESPYIEVSYPNNIEQKKFNDFVANKILYKPYRKYYQLSINSSPAQNAKQLVSPDRKQDTDTVNFIYHGQKIGSTIAHGLDGANLQVTVPRGYIANPHMHMFTDGQTHNLPLETINDSSNNLFTLNDPVLMPGEKDSDTPNNNNNNNNSNPAINPDSNNSNNSGSSTPGHNGKSGTGAATGGAGGGATGGGTTVTGGTSAGGSRGGNNSTVGPTTQGGNGNNNSNRNGANNNDVNKPNTNTNSGQYNNRAKANNYVNNVPNNTKSTTSSTTNQYPNSHNNASGGNNGNMINNNDHSVNNAANGHNDETNLAFITANANDNSNYNQLDDLTDIDMNDALSRQQIQADHDQKVWINEFNNIDHLADLIKTQQASENIQNQLRKIQFNQVLESIKNEAKIGLLNSI